jgi:hypothetical protein
MMYDMDGRVVGARRTGTKRDHIVYHGVKFVNSSTILALRVTLLQPHNHTEGLPRTPDPLWIAGGWMDSGIWGCHGIGSNL